MKKSIKVRDGMSKLEGTKNMILTIGKKSHKTPGKKKCPEKTGFKMNQSKVMHD